MTADYIQTVQESVLVIGLGMTGFSVIRHLAETGRRITVADSRELPPFLAQVKQAFPDVELIMGAIPYGRLNEFDQVIASPGIGLGDGTAVSESLIVSDIELFARSADAPVIAITGSNGKSTVTMLVTELLSAAGFKVKTGGNIGTPALDLLDRQSPDFYVLELSSFQLENTCSLKLISATVLNISEDHMDRYQELSDYADAKFRIFLHARSRVVNRDDCVTRCKMGGEISSLSFGLNAPDDDESFGVVESGEGRLMVCGNKVLARVDQATLQGDQNVANMLAAFALVESAGVKLTADMIQAALNYRGLPHRCEMVKEVNQIKWINDSKGTNVGATIAAIKGFSRRIILILGGRGKGADFSSLADVIASEVAHTIVFGEDAEIILSNLEATSEVTRVGALDEAVMESFRLSQPNDIVLFSPACASFDMFDNYEHRGNRFKQLVMELVN